MTEYQQDALYDGKRDPHWSLVELTRKVTRRGVVAGSRRVAVLIASREGVALRGGVASRLPSSEGLGGGFTSRPRITQE